MIFTSLGILVASGCFLIAGIVRSSVPLLVVSLIGTAAAAFLLLATADLARRRAWEASGMPGMPSMAVAGAAPPGTQPVVMYVPTSGPGTAVAAPPVAPAPSTATGATPFLGYDDMSAAQVTKLISSGALTVEQLVAVKKYERANASRKSVLDRIDRALRQ
jgi:hypothetical protein